ncbi:ATP-dependent helicase [Bifidobacterium choloepi]|uniref:ATP-dependent helicase n=1 Tax=Bifidobacterium choloepi TaxID=2614131 RepID=UPI001E48ACA7|nr:ATP-dependent helicase [Bifidobacterium choloepi]
MIGMISTAQALLTDLDDAQREAATAVDGPVRIIAGAGAGKTRTITRRIAYAVESGDWNPNKVLAVTFSVKAAREMKSRLDRLGVDGVTAATFHSAALRQLVGDGDRPGVWEDIVDGPFPHISEHQERNVSQAITRITNIANLNPMMVRDVHAEINWCKVQLVAPEDYPRVCSATHRQPPCALTPEQFVDVYETYETVKTSRAEIDFHDILLVACHVLEQFPEAAATIRRHIGFLTVDEYQDVSPLQHRLMRLWLGDNRNVCVVGDPAQTIYGYAGATSHYLTNFGAEFEPLTADVRLDADYRSNPPIIRCANGILNDSPVRDRYLKLHAVRTGSPRVSRLMYESDEDEARAVAAQIRAYVDRGEGRAADCAVLTRLNAQQRVFAKALEEVGLRYQLRRDNGWQESALADVPAGAQPDAQAQPDIHTQPDAQPQPYDNVDGDAGAVEAGAGATAAGGEARGSSDPTGAPDNGVGADPAPMTAADEVQRMRDVTCVTISTIHASKGLEFRQVFLVGASEGLLPYGSPPEDSDALEEERRLMYVGVTRAEDKLHVSYARRKQSGRGALRHPSRFLR